MTVVGFNFSKISIERKGSIPAKVEVKSKMNLKDVSKQDMKLVEGKDVLRFDFAYGLEYTPNLANLEFEGHLLVVLPPKEADQLIKDWKKDKKINKEVQLSAYNAIFHKCNVKAFELEEDFNLPLHLRLPGITSNEKK